MATPPADHQLAASYNRTSQGIPKQSRRHPVPHAERMPL